MILGDEANGALIDSTKVEDGLALSLQERCAKLIESVAVPSLQRRRVYLSGGLRALYFAGGSSLRRRRGRCGSGSGFRGGSGRFGAHDIDVALEVGPVFNHNARGLDIAVQLRLAADVDLIASLAIAVNGTQYDQLPRLDAGFQLPVRADGQAVFL